MKKQQLALVIEGNSTASHLLRLTPVVAELGPIKSSGLQVARRVSNFLRAGYAVNSYSELGAARTILIRVPDKSLDRVVLEIEQSGQNWNGHEFILSETWEPTEKLEPLRRLGASIASVVALPTRRGNTFVAEGDLTAVRQVRRIIDRGEARTIELPGGTKHLLFAAAALCSAVPVPVFGLAQHVLRSAGMSGNELFSAMEEMSSETVASILKGARTSWGGPLAEFLEPSRGTYWDKLFLTHPDLAQTLTQYVSLGRAVMASKSSRSQSA